MRIDTKIKRELANHFSQHDQVEAGHVLWIMCDELDRLYAIEDAVTAMCDKRNGFPKQVRDTINAQLSAIGAASEQA